MSEQSLIVSNAVSLACENIGSTSGNKTSLYMDAMFSASNCSSDSLINNFEPLFRNNSRRLCQLLRDYWYVPAWMYVFQTHITLLHCVTIQNCVGRMNWIAESLIHRDNFSSYAMENPSEYFFIVSIWSARVDTWRITFCISSVF